MPARAVTRIGSDNGEKISFIPFTSLSLSHLRLPLINHGTVKARRLFIRRFSPERASQAKTRIVIPGHGGTGGRGRQEELVRRSERRVSDPSSEKDPSRQADGDESGRISAYAMELGKLTQPGDN